MAGPKIIDSFLHVIKDAALTAKLKVAGVTTLEGLAKLQGNTGLTAGSGFAAMETYKSWVEHYGTVIKTNIFIDLTGVIGAGGALDIIGDVGAANAHIGQYTTAVMGTLFAGKFTCLELPAGGEPDIDLYSATVATGTEDTIITDLTETKLVESNADMIASGIAGTFGTFVAMPTANDYFYLCKGLATDTSEYSAGKILIEMWGSSS